MPYLGQTIMVKCKFYDFKGQVITENLTHTISLTDPNGVERFSSTSPTFDSADSSFYVEINFGSDWPTGNYKLVWKATQGSRNWVSKIAFNVESV